MCASVIAGMDASPVFEPTEHVLDLVPLTVECADRISQVQITEAEKKIQSWKRLLATPAY